MSGPACPKGRAAALALLLALVGACSEPNEYVAPPPPTVTVAQPEQRKFTDYMNFTGRTEAVNMVDLRARVEGFLKNMYFEEGDDITEGTLLYQIDPAEYDSRVKSAQASVAEAQAGVEIAQATLDRMEEAVKTNAVSVLDVLESRAKRDGAKALLESANADLIAAELDLEWTKVVAPMTGRISRTYVDPGNLVGAGESTLLTTLVQYDPIYAYFDMSERQLLSLLDAEKYERGGAAGNQDIEDYVERVRSVPLELGTSGDEGFPHEGHVHFVDSVIDAQTGTLLIRGTFPNPEPYALFPGLFVRVRIPLNEREGLLVTERALGSDQAGRFVLVVGADDVVEHRPVQIGPLIDGMRVIEEGLTPTDRVIVNGVLRARPGAKVTPVEGDAAGGRAPGAAGAGGESDTTSAQQGGSDGTDQG